MYSQSSLEACAVSHAIVDVLKFRNTAVGAKICVSAKKEDTFVYNTHFLSNAELIFSLPPFLHQGMRLLVRSPMSTARTIVFLLQAILVSYALIVLVQT